ncbi:MAG: DsrE family protein [Bacteroidota bacterium]
MKQLLTIALLLITIHIADAQERVNPIIKNYGGIYEIPEATVTPNSELQYKIVVDAKTGADDESDFAFALYNSARMINLHAAGGVQKENLKVVLAIHGGATYSILKNEVYKKKFGVDNPNIGLIRELKAAGVKLVVCGQSLIGRKVDPEDILSEIEIGTSMLTTVSTYQLSGYAVFQF